MPATPIPLWVTGQRVTAFTLIQQTIAADGTPTAGTSVALAGVWDEIDIDAEPETEEISAADAICQNFVILKDSHRIRLTQILSAVTGKNVLASSFAAGAVFQMNLTRGPNAWSIYVIRTGYTENIRKGKSVGIFTGACVGNLPSYT